MSRPNIVPDQRRVLWIVLGHSFLKESQPGVDGREIGLIDNYTLPFSERPCQKRVKLKIEALKDGRIDVGRDVFHRRIDDE